MAHQDLKGHSGAMVTLGENGGVLATISKKQKILTRSSTEADLELVAIDEGYKHAAYCRDIYSIGAIWSS
eukprot:gene28284-37326_t